MALGPGRYDTDARELCERHGALAVAVLVVSRDPEQPGGVSCAMSVPLEMRPTVLRMLASLMREVAGGMDEDANEETS